MFSDPEAAARAGNGDQERFAVAVTCIDGRVHGPIAEWARRTLGIEHLDLITEPGSDLALCCAADEALERVRANLAVSAGAHAPVALVVSGHEHCAANPAPPEEHRDQIARAVTRAAGWLDLPVVGIWVSGEGTVEVIEPEAAEAPR
jgi:hypothetical protein